MLPLGCEGTGRIGPEREPVDLLAYVKPSIGTGGIGYAVGSGFPGASVPFGMTKPSPDTANEWGMALGYARGGGYHSDDVNIQGFSQTHLHGVGLTDYGRISLMPAANFARAGTDELDYQIPFSAAQEQSSAGYYRVDLEDPHVLVELTATTHTSIHRYSYDQAIESPTVLLDLEHGMGEVNHEGAELTFDPETGTVQGFMRASGQMAYPFSLWFVATFDPPPSEWGVWEHGEQRLGDSHAEGTDVGAWFAFEPPEAPDFGSGDLHTVIEVQVALSAVDQAGAWANLEAESSNFDTAQAAAEEDWAAWLDRVRVWGGTEDERTMFATGLYHSLLMPTIYSDSDGRYPGFDGAIHNAGGRTYHTDMSLWDTYRTTHPLYTLLWPDAHEDILWSLSRMASQGGALPQWPLATWDGGFMLGLSAHIVAAEAWKKGITDFAPEALFEVAETMSLGEPPANGWPYGGPPDISRYEELGYFPADEFGSSTAWGMELAIADYAMSQVDLLADDSRAQLLERSGYWANSYDAATGFFHGRNADGTFVALESESAWLDEFTEGNVRQYLWLVPHDPKGLFDVLGGDAVAVERLTELFEEGAAAMGDFEGLPQPWYWHGNEVDIHAPWLFALAGRPDLTRTWVRWVMEKRYGTGPDGLAGNDDGGTLSAWYVWAAMGLYPLAGTDRYVLGDPVFARVEIPMGAGCFTITRMGHAEVTEVTLDGVVLETPDITHGQMRAGGELVFWSR